MITPRDAVQFTRESAERIANVVRAAELTPRGGRALNFDAVFEPRRVLRVGKFTGAWPITTQKTVTLQNDSTLTARNLTYISPVAGSCVVGRVSGEWVLIAAAEQNEIWRGSFVGPWTKGTTKTVSVGGSSVTASNPFATITATGTRQCSIARDPSTGWHLIAAEC